MSETSDKKRALTEAYVRVMYREFDTGTLREMLEIGAEHEAVAKKPEALLAVRNLNGALKREIERRESEAAR